MADNRTPFPEYSDFRDYIATPSVRAAFEYLVQASSTLLGFHSRPAPHGHITRNFHYFQDGRSPFAFIVNRQWLLFYLRMPATTHPGLTISDLRNAFPQANLLPNGEMTFRVASVDDARLAMKFVFGVQVPKGSIYPDELDPETVFVEGAAKAVQVNAYERSAAARDACIAHFGTRCAVCEMSFTEVYGVLGDGFIHVHHLVKLSSIREEYVVDPIRDLRPVCPNCHAMLHRRSPALTIEELKRNLSNKG